MRSFFNLASLVAASVSVIAASNARAGFTLDLPELLVQQSPTAQTVSVPVILNYTALDLPFVLEAADYRIDFASSSPSLQVVFAAAGFSSGIGSGTALPAPSPTTTIDVVPVNNTISISSSGTANLSGTSFNVAVLTLGIPANTPVGSVYNMSFGGFPLLSTDGATTEITPQVRTGSITITAVPEPSLLVGVLATGAMVLARKRRTV